MSRSMTVTSTKFHAFRLFCQSVFQLIEPSLTLTNIFTFCEHRHDRLTGSDRRSRPGDIGDGGNRERVATSRIIDLDLRGHHGSLGVKNCLADNRGFGGDGLRFPRGGDSTRSIPQARRCSVRSVRCVASSKTSTEAVYLGLISTSHGSSSCWM